MSRRNPEAPKPPPPIDARDGAAIFAAILDGRIASDRYAEVFKLHRESVADAGAGLLAALAGEAVDRGNRFARVEQFCEQMQELVSKLGESPWYPARVVDTSGVETNGHVMVSMAGALRFVAAGEGIELETLHPGDAVYVSRGGDAVMGVAPTLAAFGGELATFERELEDGRLLAKIRDEEVLLRRAEGMNDAVLRRGCMLRVDRAALLALENVGNQSSGSGLFTDDLAQAVVRVGGVRARQAVERLVEALTARLVAPELAQRFGLRAMRAVLLSGPPGVGKTLAVRTAIQRLSAETGRRCRFAIVRPGEFESPWVGEAEANIRRTFARLVEEAGDDLAVLFLDEIEAIGRIRGGANSRLSDKFLAALLVEIDGLVARGNIAVVAATNRKDMLDPALLERLTDIDIEMPRPDLAAAREMFDAHLPADLPYSSEAGSAEATRGRMIEQAVSALFAPNAGARVATVHFRDGTTRDVEARRLLSGRLVEQVCHRVRESGFRRAKRGEDGALRVADVRESIAETLDKLRSTLTTHNVRAWVDDLPSQLDIVRVVAERPPVARPWRYLRVA